MMDVEGRDPYLGVDMYSTVDDGDVPNYTIYTIIHTMLYSIGIHMK